MKVLYFYDEKNQFDHSKLVQDDAQIQQNSTFVAPENGLYEPITWDGSAWVGTAKEVWLKEHPVPTPEPTDQDKTNAAIMLQIARNKAVQNQFNAQAMLAIAANNGGID